MKLTKNIFHNKIYSTIVYQYLTTTTAKSLDITKIM